MPDGRDINLDNCLVLDLAETVAFQPECSVSGDKCLYTRDFLNPFEFNVVLSFIGFQDELKAIWGKVYIYIGNCRQHFFNFDENILK